MLTPTHFICPACHATYKVVAQPEPAQRESTCENCDTPFPDQAESGWLHYEYQSPASGTPFIYRCPNNGYQVQGHAPEQTAGDGDKYQSITCLACNQVHLVNPATGKVLGADGR